MMKLRVRNFVLLLFATISSPTVALHDDDGTDISSKYSERRGNRRLDLETGSTAAIYNPNFSVDGKLSSKDQADFYIQNNRDVLQLDSDENLHDLEYVSERKIASVWTVVRYRQTYKNIPVYGAKVAVTIDNNDKKVKMVTGKYWKGIELQGDDVNNPEEEVQQHLLVPQFTQEDLGRLVESLFGLQKTFEPELFVYVYDDGRNIKRPTKESVLTWVVDVNSETGLFVSAKNGDIIKTVDRRSDKRGSGQTQKRFLEVNTVESINTFSRTRASYVNGVGTVFDPDPLSSSGSTYGDDGYTDSYDRVSTQLTDELVEVILNDITEIDGNYYLAGPYAEVVDSDAPYNGLFSSTSSDFSANRDEDLFEAVMCYYHIDKYMRYINFDLGIELMPYQYGTF